MYINFTVSCFFFFWRSDNGWRFLFFLPTLLLGHCIANYLFLFFIACNVIDELQKRNIKKSFIITC